MANERKSNCPVARLLTRLCEQTKASAGNNEPSRQLWDEPLQQHGWSRRAPRKHLLPALKASLQASK
ncbi:MAG TPA: hypothetical protein VFG04_26765 [Planctomycetaceae bacterium]|jgi:hypothetical protein|nr:hypothetical protein [Planctomycetaceae bacterium]